MDIASLRKDMNLTQAQFAAALKVSHKYIGHLETGLRTPSIKLAARIEVLTGRTGLVQAVVAEKTGAAG